MQIALKEQIIAFVIMLGLCLIITGDLFQYHQGKYIQDAFPYISQATRELMLDGICSKCLDLMFKR